MLPLTAPMLWGTVSLQKPLEVEHFCRYTTPMTNHPKSQPSPAIPPREALTRVSRAARAGLISVERAAAALELPPALVPVRLAALVRKGWLKRVRRGLYLVLPLEATRSGPTTVEDPWILATELFEPCYIAGWSAAEHWGLTEQLFRSTFVASARGIRRTAVSVFGVEFRLAATTRKKLETVRPVWRGRERIALSSRERTLADALVDPTWVGGIRHLAEMLRAYASSREWNPAGLLTDMELVGTGAAYKRLGFLVETLRLPADELTAAALARRTSGVVKLDPAIGTKGRLSKRWGLWLNADIGMTEAE